MPEVMTTSEHRGEVETKVTERLNAFRQSVTQFRDAVNSGQARMPNTTRQTPVAASTGTYTTPNGGGVQHRR